MKKSQFYSLDISRQSTGTYDQNLMMVREICHVDFVNLKKLSFFRCGITSIQAIQFIYAPGLKQLQQNFNFIRDLQGLKKCLFKLQSIHLYNEVNVAGSITQSLTSNHRLSAIGLQFNQNSSIFCQDIRVFAKMPRMCN